MFTSHDEKKAKLDIRSKTQEVSKYNQNMSKEKLDTAMVLMDKHNLPINQRDGPNNILVKNLLKNEANLLTMSK